MNRCPNGCGVDLDEVRAAGKLGHLCRPPLAGQEVVLPRERDSGFRVSDVVDQGEMLGVVRETLRANIALWVNASGGGLAMLLTAGGGNPRPAIDELAELLARHVAQRVMIADVKPPAGYVIVPRADVSACGVYRYDFAPELGGGDAAHIERMPLLARGLPDRVAVVAAELEERQEKRLRAAEDANRCSGCGRPEHPSDTDDLNRCVDCVRAAGETPLTPNEKD